MALNAMENDPARSPLPPTYGKFKCFLLIIFESFPYPIIRLTEETISALSEQNEQRTQLFRQVPTIPIMDKSGQYLANSWSLLKVEEFWIEIYVVSFAADTLCQLSKYKRKILNMLCPISVSHIYCYFYYCQKV